MFNSNLVGDEFEMSACSLDIYLIFCAPVLQVVNEEFGIIEGLMTTVHATTGLCLYLSLSLSLCVKTCCMFCNKFMVFYFQQLKKLSMVLQ